MPRKVRYYVRIDSYWQNSDDYFVGPFASREAAEAAINRADRENGADIGRPGVSPRNVRCAVRVNEIVSRTHAIRRGMRDDDIIGTHVPATLEQLHALCDLASPF